MENEQFILAKSLHEILNGLYDEGNLGKTRIEFHTVINGQDIGWDVSNVIITTDMEHITIVLRSTASEF